MELSEIQPKTDLLEQREKLEVALFRLKSMRGRVTELRIQCESLRKADANKAVAKTICSECGEGIEEGLEVVAKDSSGNPKSYFHRDCFRAIWTAQDWRLDYSSPGFLSRSGIDL